MNEVRLGVGVGARTHRVGLGAALIGALLGACDEGGRDDAATDELDAALLDQDAAFTPHIADAAVTPNAAHDGSINVADAADAASSHEDYTRPPPTNVSFETALRVPTDGSGALQDELTAEQVDYFVFEVQAGAYYEITTDRHPFSPDNFIAVFDSDKELVADNDEGARWAGDGIDARLIVHPADSGDYYVRVEDLWTPPRFFESALPLLYYHLSVRELSDGTPGISIEREGSTAEIELATDEKTGFAYATLLGETGSGTDVFALQGIAERAFLGRVLLTEIPTPSEGAVWDVVQMVDADDVVIAEIADQLGQHVLHPPSAAVRYEVRVATQDALYEDRARAFYAIELVTVPENPIEQQELDNLAPEGAELIDVTGSGVRRGYLLATILPDDIDYFWFEAEAGERAFVTCEAESGGSQVLGLRAALLDADQQELSSARETPTKNLETPVVDLLEGGTYYVRLSSDTEQSVGAATWARCMVAVSFF